MKKAQVPEGVIILAAVAICILSLYYTITFPGKTASAISMENVSGMFNEQKKFMVFADEAADLAAQKALADISIFPSGTKCGQTGSTAIWTDGCPDNNEIKEEFSKTLKASLVNYGLEAEKIEFEGKKVIITLKEKSAEIKEKNDFIYYRMNYTYTPKISASADLDFEKIYSAVKAKNNECGKTASADCISALQLDDWNVNVISSGNYDSFTLNSKKSYFYDNSFKPIVLAFAIKI